MADSEFTQLSKTQRNPVQESRYQELLKQGGDTGSGDLQGTVAQTLKMYQDANKPAVEALQAQIPTIGQQFQQTGDFLKKQVTNLDTRYNDLLTSIKGAAGRAVEATKTNVSQELGRRGISAEGGLFGQTVNKATQPIEEAFAGNVAEVGATRQRALDTILNQIAQLPISQAQQENAVRTAIAQLQSGASSTAITQALALQQQEADRALQQQQLDSTKQLQDFNMSFANQLNPIELALKQAELTKAQQSNATGTGSLGIADLWKQFRNEQLTGMSMEDAKNAGYTIGPAVYQ